MVTVSPFFMDDAGGVERGRGIVDPDAANARDAGLAHAARDHGRMRCHAAAGGENAFGGMHAVNVLWAGLDAHQDDALAGRLQALGFIRIEDDGAGGRARRGREALADHLALGLGIERRMEKLVERGRIDAADRVLAADQAFRHHVGGDLECGLGGALAGAGLEHPQAAILDREFQILHVAIMLLEPGESFGQFAEGLGHQGFERGLVGTGLDAGGFGDVLRRADAGDDILALRIDEELAVKRLVAGRRIAGEGNAGRGGLAEIAEDHGLDRDRRAPVARDAVELAIGDGAGRHPGFEDRADRAP